MPAERPLCVLIGAVGGQGGGVLADWLVEAARLAGYPAQCTSIPGVAQRTGATTYYFELYPETQPEGDPVFCLFPSADDVDLVAALEPTEAGRALERGYVTGRTTVITAVSRVLSTAEKVVAGDGTLEVRPILEALAAASWRLICLEPGNPFGLQLNAALFGAVIGSGILPLTADHARAAIEARGLAVQANREGLEAGLAVVERAALTPNPAPGGKGVGVRLAAQLTPMTPPPPGWEKELGAWPSALRPLLGHALARLEEYQDRAYARLYLERLRPVRDADADPDLRLTLEAARRLAAWMCFEDVFRVAQLKTRPGRLGRLRRSIGARAGEPVEVVDFLSPSRAEFLGMLPAALQPVAPVAERPHSPGGAKLTWPTSAPWGFAALKLLAALRPLRPRGVAYAREQRAIETWLQAVQHTVPVDYELACDVAALAVWARGYGEVRTRGLARLQAALADWPRSLARAPEAARQRVSESLRAARHAPDGE